MLNVGVDKDGLAFIAPSVANNSAGGCGSGCGCDSPSPAFKRREHEPADALLQPWNDARVSQRGKALELVDDTHAFAGKGVKIIGCDAISANLDRYKQHGFRSSADNCIGCHAGEAACSEKDNLPAHISFRSVGY